MYQVGIRLHDAAGDTIEEKAANAAAQGFKCVHIALGKLIKDYSTADSALTPGFAMYLKKLFGVAVKDVNKTVTFKKVEGKAKLTVKQKVTTYNFFDNLV